ncbi:MAG: FmdB family zinc ribbon protein [Syntrophorhabdaceae bacterium]
MPIYEYTCRKCGNEFEVIIFGNDVPECPACGDSDCQKNMSSFGFSMGDKFKASGKSGGGCSGCSSSDCSGCS